MSAGGIMLRRTPTRRASGGNRLACADLEMNQCTSGQQAVTTERPCKTRSTASVILISQLVRRPLIVWAYPVALRGGSGSYFGFNPPNPMQSSASHPRFLEMRLGTGPSANTWRAFTVPAWSTLPTAFKASGSEVSGFLFLRWGG